MSGMADGKISVIIPVYNVEAYLDRCLWSIVNQTYKNLEIILIDDGSQDNSGVLCDVWRKNDSRIEVIHTDNQGVSCARNEGLNRATGDFISFVDADDWLEEDMYALMVSNINENVADICISGYVLSTQNGDVFAFEIEAERLYTCEETIREVFTPRSSRIMGWELVDKLFRRHAVNSCRFKQDCSISEDKLFFWQVLKNVKCVSYFPLHKYHYFMRGDSAVHSLGIRHILDDVSVSRELYRLSRKEVPNLNRLMRLRYYMTLIAAIRKMLIIECNDKVKNFYITQYAEEIRKNVFFILRSEFSLPYKLGVIYACLPIGTMKILGFAVRRYKTRADLY